MKSQKINIHIKQHIINSLQTPINNSTKNHCGKLFIKKGLDFPVNYTILKQ